MKPNNLLLGSDGQLKLADFGLARIFGSPDRRFTHQVTSHCRFGSPKTCQSLALFSCAVALHLEAGAIFMLSNH